nr:1-deoxy-D-xylulose-5-phosphate synthase [Prolixibacteraceae bacterium]
ILTIGKPGVFAQRAVKKLLREGLTVAHFDMRFVKPLDEVRLHYIFREFPKIITIEEGTVTGGFGSAVAEFKSAHNYSSQLKIMGIPDRFIEHGTIEQLYKECGLDAESIFREALIMAGR